MSVTTTITSQVNEMNQAVTEWTKLFPKTVTENYTSSITFIKQLTVVAVSTITYLKSAFSEENYTVESFGGVKLRILKKKCRDELAQFVSSALAQAFEAFDKKYLHQLALCFYDGECKLENLIEYHIFEYSYNSDGVSMDVHSKTQDNATRSVKYSFDNVKNRTISLIRAIVVILQTCPTELPASYDISLRLYYNEDAPDGYQAPGFLSALEATDHLEGTVHAAIKLGAVDTPHHKLLVLTYSKDYIEFSHQANPSENPPIMTQNEDAPADTTGFEQKSVSEYDSDELRTQVQCPCNKFDEDPDPKLMLTCQFCNTKQHASCFGVYRGDVARVSRHCCATCYDADTSRTPTDQTLAELNVKKRECLCIFRRTLDWCSEMQTVRGAQLVDKFLISYVNAFKLMKLLHSHGIIAKEPGSDLTVPREIIPEELKTVMGKHFRTLETNIVDRLVAETLSQGSQPDPVGDVLGSMEKVSLQKATNLSRIIKPTKPQLIVEDATLKQYKEAILSNQYIDEDLPPNDSHNPGKGAEKLGKKKSIKRKNKESEGRVLRTGVRTKKAKTMD